MPFWMRPTQPRPDPALIEHLRVRYLLAPTSNATIPNLTGLGGVLTPGAYAYGNQKVRFGPGGLGYENDGTDDYTHFATNSEPMGVPLETTSTLFGVASFRSLGTNRLVLCISNSDSRFEVRVESDDVNGLAIAYWDNYVLGQRYSVGSLPQLNVPIAFVARMNGSGLLKMDLSDGTKASGTGSGHTQHYHGYVDLGVRLDGWIYMAGGANGMWSDEDTYSFLDNPYSLISREVDAPIVVEAAGPTFPIWAMKNRFHRPKQISTLRR
jgi:hypothetical protein